MSSTLRTSHWAPNLHIHNCVFILCVWCMCTCVCAPIFERAGMCILYCTYEGQRSTLFVSPSTFMYILGQELRSTAQMPYPRNQPLAPTFIIFFQKCTSFRCPQNPVHLGACPGRELSVSCPGFLLVSEDQIDTARRWAGKTLGPST